MDGRTSSGPANPGVDAGDAFDHLNEFYNARQGVSSPGASNTVGAEWPARIPISPEPTFVLVRSRRQCRFMRPWTRTTLRRRTHNFPFWTLGTHPIRPGLFMNYTSTPGAAATSGSERGTLPYHMTPPSSVSSPSAFTQSTFDGLLAPMQHIRIRSMSGESVVCSDSCSAVDPGRSKRRRLLRAMRDGTLKQ